MNHARWFRRSAVVIGLSIAGWWLAAWWTGPVVMNSIAIPGEGSVSIVGFSRRGDVIAAGLDPADERDLVIWSWNAPGFRRSELWRRRVEHGDANDSMHFGSLLSEDGRWLAVHDDRTASSNSPPARLIIDLETGRKHPHEKSGEVWISPDGRFLFHDDRDAGIEVSRFETGEVIGRIDDSWIHDISGDGTWVLAGTGDSLRLWNVRPDGFLSMPIADRAPDESSAYPYVIGHDESAAITQRHSTHSRFNADSTKLAVFGETYLHVWQLDPFQEIVANDLVSVLAVPVDLERAYLNDGSAIRLDHAGKSIASPVLESRNFELGPLLDDIRWFLAVRKPDWDTWTSWGPTGGFSIPIGPYDLTLSRRDADSDGKHVLVDFDRGTEVSLPRGLMQSQIVGISDHFTGYESPQVFHHPRQLAVRPHDGSTLRIIPLPPRRPWTAQLSIWLALTAACVVLLRLRWSRSGAVASRESRH
jgi:hypothetical protein